MTIQVMSSGFIPPVAQQFTGGAPLFSPFSVDADGEKFAVVCQSPFTGSIRNIAFRLGNNAATRTIDTRLETVVAGEPSGTLWAANTNSTTTVDVAADDSWITSTAFTSDASVTKGQWIALVWVLSTGGTNNIQFDTFTRAYIDGTYILTDTGAGYTIDNDSIPCVGIKDSSGVWHPILGADPMETITATTFNSGDTITRRALRFSFPYPARVTGGWVWIDHDGDCDVKLYDSDGSTVLSDINLDKDIRRTSGAMVKKFYLDNTVSLSKDTEYRLSFEPSSVTDLTLYDFTVNAVGLLDAMEGGGQDFHLSTYDGSWTQATTRRPFAGLYLDGFDDGVGGGGALPRTRLQVVGN